MAGKLETAKDIVVKIRQVESLQGHCRSVPDVVRQIGVAAQTYYW